MKMERASSSLNSESGSDISSEALVSTRKQNGLATPKSTVDIFNAIKNLKCLTTALFIDLQ
jgi:hypothetical protein